MHRTRGRSIVATVALLTVAMSAMGSGQAFAIGTLVARAAWAPDLSGNRLVWSQAVLNSRKKVYTKDLATGAQLVLTDGARDASNPRVSQNRVVWSEFQFMTPVSISMVFGYGLGDGWSPTIMADDAFFPDVNGKWVVFNRILSDQVVLTDTSNGTGRILSNYHPRSDDPPALSSKYAVWSDTRNSGDDDIYYNVLGSNTVANIDPNAPYSNEYQPAVSGEWVVWTDDRNGNLDIYGRNMALKQNRAIAVAPGAQSKPSVSGDLVVWQDTRNGNEDIYLYDLLTRQSRRLTTESARQINPTVAGLRVAWEDYRSGSSLPDIYTVTLSPRAVTIGGAASVRKGTTTRVAGQALGVAKMPFAWRTVSLQRSYDGVTWTTVKTTTTNSLGTYAFTTPAIGSKTSFRVRFSMTGLTLTSPVKNISVY